MSVTAEVARPSAWHDKLERRWLAYVFLLPALVVLTVVAVVPFAYAVFISFHHTEFLDVQGFAGVDNYTDLLSDSRFWGSLGVTALIMAVAVPVEMALGLAMALLLYRGVLGGRVLSPALLLPAVVAPTVVAIIWKIMLAGTWGLLTYEIFDRFGWFSEGSILSVSWSAVAAIIAIDVWQWTPFVVLALFAGLQALPLSPFRAAAVDGASRWDVFRSLTFPMILPLFAVLFLLRILDTFKIFDTIFVLTGGGPGDATRTISLFLYQNVFDFLELGRATAGAAVIFVLFFIIVSIFYRLMDRKLRIFR
jgi:multiple sugar transport system permease protein